MQKKTIQLLSILLFLASLGWGIYTLMVYLGVQVHGLVLLSGEQEAAVSAVCGRGEFLCRGWETLVPFIAHTFSRAQPFLWYVVVSAVLYLGYVGWQWLKHEHFTLSLTLKPWKILLGFLFLIWLVFTVLSNTNVGDTPVRRMYEPLPQVYVNAGEEAMQELQANFQSLMDRGCLRKIGETNHDAGIFELSGLCIQTSFVTRVFPLFLSLLYLSFVLLIVGRAILKQIRPRPQTLLIESIMSVALGACALVAALWLLAVAGLFTSIAGWILLLGIPVLLFPHAKYWFRQFLSASWTVEVRAYSLTILLTWLLLSYLALNFITVIRPFPIGWDDLGSYLNRPRLMVSYGKFIFSMSPFQWEYLTSLGFLLYGFDSIFGATQSMMINWFAGILAVSTVYAFSRTFLGRGGVLAALLYYALPLVGHFSYADMKIDNAVFTMGALCIFALFLCLFPIADVQSEGAEHEPDMRWLIVAGIFAGFAFAMKATAVMVIMAAGAVLVGVSLHWLAFLGGMAGALLLFALKGALNLKGITTRIFGEGGSSLTTMFLAIFVLATAGCIAYAAYVGRDRILRTAQMAGIFAAAFLVSIAPWVIHNNILLGNFLPRFETGAPNTLSPTIALGGRESVPDNGQDIRTLPPELAVDLTNPACTPTGNIEELDRYWGFRQGWRHYLDLPWRMVMNLDATGYYVTTMPALLLIPLLLLVPYFWQRRGRWARWLFAGTLFILFQWMLLANGIPWYGIGMFLGFVTLLEIYVTRAPDTLNRALAGTLVGFSLLTMFGMRFWQFEQQRSILEYPFGKITASALRERTIPHYDDITEIVLDRKAKIPTRPYLYRVGTFIPYFIPKNLEVIGSTDHQLDTFNCLYQEKNPELTLQRLKALGFNSIIFDTNTATIEKDPNGTLHQKVQAFANMLNSPALGLPVLVNDPDAGVAFVLIP
ncbi:MAG: glycosyltransferase family 39 protein [Candidatus Peregrinibacteria bacterium]|nr:glycosyltransferase family 39 protein [Candidatus Peregrinibacteria bacterium]